jgi:hypothetical protein
MGWINRAEAMSCGGCHQNSNDAEIAPNVNWPKSKSFVHVDEQGNLSPALTRQFLPARAALLADKFNAASLLLMMVCKFELVALAVLSLALESD